MAGVLFCEKFVVLNCIEKRFFYFKCNIKEKFELLGISW